MSAISMMEKKNRFAATHENDSHSHSHDGGHVHGHDHGEACGCGHDHEEHGHVHGEACDCGHDHEEHDHMHGETCDCGHDHGEHDHVHGEACDCGHDHGAHSHDHGEQSFMETAVQNPKKHLKGCEKRTFILENLGCANCAAKMEQKISQLPQVESVSITFATKQLRLSAQGVDALLPSITGICTAIESGVRLQPVEGTGKKAAHEEAHNDKKELGALLIGAALLIAGKLMEGTMPLLSFLVYVIAYVILGGQVLAQAVKNIGKGQIFDENFLMSVATIGAFGMREYAEAVGVMLFYRVGEYFEHKAVEKSRSQIMDAVDMRPETVNLVNGDEVTVIGAEEAAAGDVVLIRPGDRIPLDGVIIEGESRIDTSPITGEPVPVRAAIGSEVISGCVNTSGVIKVRVEKVLQESMVTRILDSVENAAASKPEIEKFITRFSRVYTPIVIVLAVFTAIVPSLITGDWQRYVYAALEFLVISCPCALVLSVPLAFFSGIGAGSREGILFKGGTSLEALKGIKAVVMDKTGTITKGNFEVQQAVPAAGATEKMLFSLAAACELDSTHPIGVSIVEAARGRKLTPLRPDSVKELAGEGIVAQIEGKEVLCGNRKLMERHNVQISGAASGQGTQVFLAQDGTYIGRLVIADTIKEDASSAIVKLKKQSIMTAMLTGDAEETARSVAEQTGVDEIHARLMPQDKLSVLQQIREKHGAVMFVGDGINDAPVLAGADVGAAMGSGADAAIEAADVVFMTSEMEAIPRSIAIARKTGRIAVQNVVFALGIKILIMVLSVAVTMPMWMAVFADSGVAMLCVLNSIRILYGKK